MNEKDDTSRSAHHTVRTDDPAIILLPAQAEWRVSRLGRECASHQFGSYCDGLQESVSVGLGSAGISNSLQRPLLRWQGQRRSNLRIAFWKLGLAAATWFGFGFATPTAGSATDSALIFLCDMMVVVRPMKTATWSKSYNVGAMERRGANH